MEHQFIRIDRLTNSLRNVRTGDIFDTEFYRVTDNDVPLLQTNWSFDWIQEMNAVGAEVWKLVIVHNPTIIQGLLSISDRQDHVFVNLVENSYFNLGKNKVYEGVDGNLFAFACKRSFEIGSEGLVSFIAKSRLVRHYEQMLGAVRLGSSLRMIIDTPQAEKLCKRYFPSL